MTEEAKNRNSIVTAGIVFVFLVLCILLYQMPNNVGLTPEQACLAKFVNSEGLLNPTLEWFTDGDRVATVRMYDDRCAPRCTATKTWYGWVAADSGFSPPICQLTP